MVCAAARRVPGALGNDFDELFDLAMRVGRFAHAIAWARQREFLTPEQTAFDQWFAHVLRRALDVT